MIFLLKKENLMLSFVEKHFNWSTLLCFNTFLGFYVAHSRCPSILCRIHINNYPTGLTIFPYTLLIVTNKYWLRLFKFVYLSSLWNLEFTKTRRFRVTSTSNVWRFYMKLLTCLAVLQCFFFEMLPEYFFPFELLKYHCLFKQTNY